MTPYYEDGSVTIYHGDCLDVLPELHGGSVDLVITDPPYVIGAVSAGNMNSKAGGWGDMMNSARWFRDWYRECHRILKHSGALWTFCNWRSLPVVMKAAIDSDFPVASCLVWDKALMGPGGIVGLRPAYELVALLPKPDFTIANRALVDVWRVPWLTTKPTGHPAEKPVELLSKIARESGGGLILDPFMGSGSTLVAAKNLGYRAIGVETDEKWCELAARRLSQDTLGLSDEEPAA